MTFDFLGIFDLVAADCVLPLCTRITYQIRMPEPLLRWASILRRRNARTPISILATMLAGTGEIMRCLAVVIAVASLAGCASAEKVAFVPKNNQEAMIRDGQAAIVSRKATSIVMVRPASRQFQSGSRPVYVVGVYNLGAKPTNFLTTNISAHQQIKSQRVALKVFSYDELVQEERNRQVAAAIITGLAAAGNAYSASRAGYYNSSSNVYTPRGGVYRVETTGFSPTANAIAQSNAAAQNEAMISATIERGQANLAELEKTILKDNTLFPGEWYGGQLHIQSPERSDGAKSYSIALLVGSDHHEIEISQTSVR
jgi:hypothetical protein